MSTVSFQNVDFVRDDSRRVVAVIAICVGCQAERSLSFSEVIGGVALRCPICGARGRGQGAVKRVRRLAYMTRN